MKKIYRLPPCSIYDVPATETWLSDMAQSGLYLQKAGRSYFIFQKDVPSDTCYRLEPVTGSIPSPDCEIQEHYAQAGWKFVTTVHKSFYIWQRMRPDADELHSDPVVHSTAYEQLLKHLKKNALVYAIFPIVLLAFFLFIMHVSPQPVTLFLASPSMPFLIAAEFLFGIQAVKQFVTLRRLKQSLASGIPAPHQKNYRKGSVPYRITNTCISILQFLIIAMAFCVLILNRKESILGTDTVLPCLPLDILEQNPDFAWHKDSYLKNGTDTFNRISYTWSPFVPVHYDIYQQGEVQDIYQHGDTIATVPSASTEYFQLLFSSLAVPLYKEQLKNSLGLHHDPVITELSHPGFDCVTVTVSDGFSQLFACRGRQVIHIRYWGNAKLDENLDTLADVLARQQAE